MSKGEMNKNADEEEILKNSSKTMRSPGKNEEDNKTIEEINTTTESEKLTEEVNKKNGSNKQGGKRN